MSNMSGTSPESSTNGKFINNGISGWRKPTALYEIVLMRGKENGIR